MIFKQISVIVLFRSMHRAILFKKYPDTFAVHTAHSYQFAKPFATSRHSAIPFVEKYAAALAKPQVKSLTTPASDSVPTRPIRQEPGVVRLGFIPDEWLTFFCTKTGVTGLGTFCFTFSIFLISKEYYVLEHEYYNGLSMAALCILITKYIGPELAKLLDEEIDDCERSWSEARTNNTKTLEDAIQHEHKLQDSMEGQLILVDAKRENVALQLEAVYRERCMYAYRETVKRLEFCMMRETVELAFARRTMADWVVEQVRKSVTEKIKEESLKKCFEDLKLLAESLKNVSSSYPDPEPSDDSSTQKS